MTENHSDLKAVRTHESNTSCYIQHGWMCAETCTTQKHRRREKKKIMKQNPHKESFLKNAANKRYNSTCF